MKPLLWLLAEDKSLALEFSNRVLIPALASEPASFNPCAEIPMQIPMHTRGLYMPSDRVPEALRSALISAKHLEGRDPMKRLKAQYRSFLQMFFPHSPLEGDMAMLGIGREELYSLVALHDKMYGECIGSVSVRLEDVAKFLAAANELARLTAAYRMDVGC